jgi:hypothetical protein
MTATVCANCAIVDSTRNERREDHHVLVEDGLIREVADRPIRSDACFRAPGRPAT